MPGPGPEAQDRRQAWFGPAYVAKIAAQAGYTWQATAAENDVHSFDGFVGIHPGTQLSVQIKCFRGSFVRSKSYPIKDAWRENWQELKQPAYFVVVEVTNDPINWVDHDVNTSCTLERASAYWTRVDPLGPDQRSISVQRAQRLTSETFETWNQEFREYLRNHGLLEGENL